MKTVILLKYASISSLSYFKEKNIARKIVIASFIILLLVLITVETLLLYFIFSEFKKQNIDIQVYKYILSLTLFFIFLLSFISSLGQNLKNIVIRKEEQYLLSFPILKSNIMLFKISRIFTFSFFIILIFSLPVLYVYFALYGYGIMYYILSVILIGLLALIILSLTTCIALIFNKLFKRFRNGWEDIVILIFLIFGYLIVSSYLSNFASLADVKTVEGFVSIFSQKALPSLLPTSLIINIIMGLNSIFSFFILLFQTIILTILLIILLKSEFTFLQPQEKSRISFLKIKQFSVFSKDLNVYISEEMRIVNTSSIFLLLCVLIIILWNIREIPIAPQYQKLFFSTITIIFGYLLCIIGLYFIFPSFSQEGRAGWLLFSSPIKRASIVKQKLSGALLFMIFHSLIFSTILLSLLSFPFQSKILFIFFTLVFAINLSLFFSSIGGAYPNFAKRDLEDLSTTPSGLLATVISILYIFLSVYIFYNLPLIIFIALFLLLSFLLIIPPLILVFKNVKKMDFAVR